MALQPDHRQQYLSSMTGAESVCEPAQLDRNAWEGGKPDWDWALSFAPRTVCQAASQTVTAGDCRLSLSSPCVGSGGLGAPWYLSGKLWGMRLTIRP